MWRPEYLKRALDLGRGMRIVTGVILAEAGVRGWMRFGVQAAILAGGVAMLAAAGAFAAPPAADKPIPLDGFDDAVGHWKNAHGDADARYPATDYKAIADNILLLQRDTGGWIQNQDPTRVFPAAEKAELAKLKSVDAISFDNRNVYTQIAYLAEAFNRSGDARYRDSALRGLEAALSKQMASCGGWPHTLPAKESYNDTLTFADEVMSGMLVMLRDVSGGGAPYQFIDAPTRARVKDALAKAEACVLKLQVVQGGKRTGWAGQYDPVTLKPSMGRKFELPSIASQESVAMLRYLMSVPDPSTEMIAAIEGGLEWLERSKITGMRLETFKVDPPVKYPYHTMTEDRRLVADASAPLLWARFYDVDDNSVVLANRDSKRVQTYAEIDPERRSGYAWYGAWGGNLLAKDAPKWRKRHGR